MAANHVYYEVGSDCDTILAEDDKRFADFEEGPRRCSTRHRIGRAWEALLSHWRIVESALLIAILVLLVAIYRDLPRQNREMQIGGDITNFAPRCTRYLTFYLINY